MGQTFSEDLNNRQQLNLLRKTDQPGAAQAAGNTSSSSSSTGGAAAKTDKNGPTTIFSDRVWGRPERFVHFENSVEIQKDITTIQADKADYSFLEDEVHAYSNVRVRRNGDCYTGDSMRMQLDSNVGNVIKPTYQLELSKARGEADNIQFLDEERSTVNQGTYSTCEGTSPDWYLRADTLDLDTGLDTGVAHKSVLYFLGTPILAAPSMSFPLSGARHSGWLPPTVGATSKGGPEIGLPYYFNIAPNRDLTLYPKWITRRGLQLGADARYMGETYKGETTVEGLVSDRVTNTNRYALTSIYEQRLQPNWTLGWNINLASDDNYPSDFSNSITKTAERLLPRDISTTYYGSFWNLNLRATNYQVLQDVTAVTPIPRPYDRLPQIQYHAEQHDVAGLDWSMDAVLTRFWHPDLVRGDRLVINPQISLPLVQPGYFITPKLSFHANAYELNNVAPGQQTAFHNFIPTFSVDSGMVFERPNTLFGNPVTQTLEPRLFYVLTPNRDQSQLPNFDTALADFNFAQIFSENRFSGLDRVGDANQITAALISRYIEMDGEERLKLAIGQRFYFNTQQVTLDGSVNPSRSDLLLAASGKLSRELMAETAFQLSQSNHQSVQASYGFRWQPETKKILNLSYNYQRDTLEQIDVSGQWPIANRWYVVGRSNYSLMDKRVVEGLAGFEYRADCWALRFVAQRFATSSTSSSSGFSLQLELFGLAKLGVGGNPLEALRKNIYGYQPNNER